MAVLTKNKKQMSTEIVKLNPSEFGIEDSKAAEIAAQFKPMLDKMVELENEYNEVIALPIELASTAKKAKEVRLKYVKVRTGTKDIHKAQKEFYLAGGRFVDGWKNAQHFASIGKEDKLERIEKHAETLEKNRVDLLHATRGLLLPDGNVHGQHLGLMSDEVWDIFLNGAIANDKAKKEQEELARLAEQEARQRREIEESRLRAENEALKAERDKVNAIRAQRSKELAPYIRFIRDYNKMLELDEKEYQEELLSVKKGAELEAEKERVKQEEFRKQIEAEAREAAQKHAEELAAIHAERIKEDELSKGDSEKVESLISDLRALSKKYSFKSKKHKAVYASVGDLLEKVVVYIEQKSGK